MFANKTPWLVLLALWMLASTWWHVCRVKQLCVDNGPAAQTASVRPETPDRLLIADGDRFRLELPGNFTFAKSGANANLNALSRAGRSGSLDKLTAYLKANRNRTLTITGYYAADEANPTAFDNLGLARAEGIKQYLIQQGVRSRSLTTRGERNNALQGTTKGDSLNGGIAFAFGGKDAPPTVAEVETTASDAPAQPSVASPAMETIAVGITEEQLAAAETYTSVFTPIDLYFPLSGSSYIRTPETGRFFDEAARYLATHPDKQLFVTGYTDDTGPDEVNRRLSRNRARRVQRALRQWRIDEDRIVVDARGEADPKASNETREGRKANRRVTVVVR